MRPSAISEKNKFTLKVINELKNKDIKVVLKNHNETLIGKIIDFNQDKRHNHLIVFQSQNQIVMFKKKKNTIYRPLFKMKKINELLTHYKLIRRIFYMILSYFIFLCGIILVINHL